MSKLFSILNKLVQTDSRSSNCALKMRKRPKQVGECLLPSLYNIIASIRFMEYFMSQIDSK